MITYKMCGCFAEADLTSDDSVEAPRVCVGDDYCFVLRDDGWWWDVYFVYDPDVESFKAVLAELNHVTPSEIEIVPQTT